MNAEEKYPRNEDSGRHTPLAPNSLLGKKKAHIEQVLNLVEGNMDKAAELLGISVAELHRWMRKCEIPERNDVRHSDTESS